MSLHFKTVVGGLASRKHCRTADEDDGDDDDGEDGDDHDDDGSPEAVSQF